ncbi:uncharacterized protein BP5553_02662 [Venustampulla echinocandica]|uniref:Extracelular serine carboxypeptidase-like protein n=1 Tax=Venustampulla echinocandica TaxID=2656787 RepID=A0A370TS00_9HELO|nr:uncharacterized protein BP5553_02662 [Venustampulla echinocandica]RDL38322.1 hypothetical protein BP5553_02662 [Venustampulla echinocandica]
MRFLSVLAGFVGLASAMLKVKHRGLDQQSDPLNRRESAAYPANTIDMPIDHFPHNPRYAPHVTGTFKQRYFFDSSYYKPGGPVYLYISGETSGTNRFSNLQTGIIQILMEATNGLGVIIEDRYYGKSYPFANSTTDNLRYLTTEQTIADNAYFAQHATFPGVEGNLTAPGTPWILYGGSLAGGETAFSLKEYGDILFGGIASSAPVKTVLPYPEWYDPIQKYGPQDCISSVNAIVEKIDYLVDSHKEEAINELKAIFGLEKLKDIRDFAMTIAFPIGGPMNYPKDTWQELNWYPAYSAPDFFDFCSNVTNINAPASVTAFDNALAKYTHGKPWVNLGNYADFFKKAFLPLCPSGDYDSTSCFGTQNASFWADESNGPGRSYLYTSNNGVLGPSHAESTTPSLELQISEQPTNTAASISKLIDLPIDPWLGLCYHAPGTPVRESSDLNPEYLIAGAGHHWDSSGIKNIPAEPLFIQQAHLWEIKTVQKWLRTFKDWKPGHGK